MSQRTPSQRSAIAATRGGGGLPQGRQRRVELQHLGPRREVRVAATGDDRIADGEEAAGRGRGRRPCRARTTPGARRPTGGRGRRGWARSRGSGRRPVAASAARAAASPASPPSVVVDDVVADAVRRADDVGIGEVGQRRALAAGSCGSVRAIAAPAGLRAHTPISQTASTPAPATSSHTSSGTSPSVTGRPRASARSCSQTHVKISWTSGFGGSLTDGCRAPRGPWRLSAIGSPVTRR